ncbi:uncharacterized protein LOC131817370 isoform X14 [Mustela lutreola]|uniref:uncharacterized protein LOC131817370 isoform X14 n=1 Tax=Mustela lutreola TaxID=9666 RepID=UPI0027971D3B|nr:uncharacterized protein LOC131817370 isoform X14 [Mustela lutreola]
MDTSISWVTSWLVKRSGSSQHWVIEWCCLHLRLKFTLLIMSATWKWRSPSVKARPDHVFGAREEARECEEKGDCSCPSRIPT